MSEKTGLPMAFVFEDRPLPSTDLYIIPALEANGYLIRRCYPGNMPEASDLNGHMVIVVRYLNASLKRLIEAVRKDLGGLVYFMDDDLLDFNAANSTPVLYRLYIYWKIQLHRKWLFAQKPVYWVSTDYLQNKYSELNPRLVSPCPLPIKDSALIKVFYHGTSTHHEEIRWLKPIIQQVVNLHEHIVFELVGGAGVRKWFKNVPRVHVFHEMNWPDYQSFIITNRYDIGLAPQLENAFNDARSYTKFLDITRSGAVGIYARDSASASVVSHNQNGLIVTMEQKKWVDAILKLAGDRKSISDMHDRALVKYQQLAVEAQPSHSALFKDVDFTGMKN